VALDPKQQAYMDNLKAARLAATKIGR
jgi:hypothetical protein